MYFKFHVSFNIVRLLRQAPAAPASLRAGGEVTEDEMRRDEIQNVQIFHLNVCLIRNLKIQNNQHIRRSSNTSNSLSHKKLSPHLGINK